MKYYIVIFFGLCISMLLLMIVFFVSSYRKEYNFIKFYNKKIGYVCDWDKYNSMVKVQKKLLYKKRIQLCILKIFVKVHGVFNGID